MSDVKTSLVCLPAFPISITTGLIVLIDRALVTYGYNVRVLTIMNVDGNFSNGDCWGRSLSSCRAGKDTQHRGTKRKRGTGTLDRERIRFGTSQR